RALLIGLRLQAGPAGQVAANPIQPHSRIINNGLFPWGVGRGAPAAFFQPTRRSREGYNPLVMTHSETGPASAPGRLKVFLGYASGVGKSFGMFDEGRRRKERGQDVVVGALQTKVSPEIEPLLNTIESVPMLAVKGVPVMDVEAILRRHPQIC